MLLAIELVYGEFINEALSIAFIRAEMHGLREET